MNPAITLQIEALPRFGDSTVHLDSPLAKRSLAIWQSVLKPGTVVWVNDGESRVQATLRPLIETPVPVPGAKLVAQLHWGTYQELEVIPQPDPQESVVEGEVVEGTEDWDRMEHMEREWERQARED